MGESFGKEVTTVDEKDLEADVHEEPMDKP